LTDAGETVTKLRSGSVDIRRHESSPSLEERYTYCPVKIFFF